MGPKSCCWRRSGLIPPADAAPRLLLEARVDVWSRDLRYKRTCIHYAAAKGHAQVHRCTTQSPPVSSGSLLVVCS